MSGDFLQQMARGSLQRVAEAKRRASEAGLRELAQGTPSPPPLVLSPTGFDLIAELKRRSPAAGLLAAASDAVAERVEAYARAGAAAVSVLTEPTRFDGSLQHLESAAGALKPCGVPAMRKDFVVDPYQLLEARVAGAGGVLLILRMLSAEQITALIECAHVSVECRTHENESAAGHEVTAQRHVTHGNRDWDFHTERERAVAAGGA